MPHDDDNPNFLDATDLEPDQTWEPESWDPLDLPECDKCGEGSDDLCVVSSHRTDPETGARDDDRMLCPKCIGRGK